MRFNDLLHLIAFPGKAHGRPPASGFVIATKMPDSCALSKFSDQFHPLHTPVSASAGEPEQLRVRRGLHGVYPRECGGTVQRLGLGTSPLGLSPRVRGNLRTSSNGEQMQRSIPASAGEPPVGALRFTTNGVYPASAGEPAAAEKAAAAAAAAVYPRECGGTTASIVINNNYTGLSPRVRGNLRPLPR